jgi:uncharacterized membrane protein YphA (DoxX/SURF4 family)
MMVEIVTLLARLLLAGVFLAAGVGNLLEHRAAGRARWKTPCCRPEPCRSSVGVAR